MLVKTILNHVEKHKSFVYQAVRFNSDSSRPFMDVEIRPRASSSPICSICSLPGPGYDTLSPQRRFEFVPLWGIAVFFVYAMRRVVVSPASEPANFTGLLPAIASLDDSPSGHADFTFFVPHFLFPTPADGLVSAAS